MIVAILLWKGLVALWTEEDVWIDHLLFILCIVGDLRKEEEDGKGATFNARFNHALFVGKDNSTSVAVLEPTSPFLTHTHVVEAPITDEGLERERRRRRENGL